MEEKNYTGLIPGQQEGDAVTAQTVREFADAAEATRFFGITKERLLDVNGWQELAGEALAHFMLADSSGNPAYGQAEEGMRIRINIPGPGGAGGHGYDWVTIEEVREVAEGDVQSMALRVRPVPAPDSDREDAAHFYDRASTSTFTLTRENRHITAAVYDRNIKPNTDTDSLIDKVRNAITGFFGEKAFSKIQWQSMTDGLLR